MSPQSRWMAGILLILLPAVIYGGVSILTMLIGNPSYAQNELSEPIKTLMRGS
jgi:hypothetical protein